MSENPEQNIEKKEVSGFVQKGPFVNGTEIIMSELNSNLEQTGNVFSTQITNNKGSFEIKNAALTSSFVEFSSSGFYFDEVKGDISASQLNLYALSDITNISTVNVNLMTHLEKRRVEFLINNDYSFSEAKELAQTEILSIFGFEKDAMQESESLDISVNTEDNAILLAISVILQGDKSVGDLTELLADISSDLEKDGKLDNQDIFNNLRNTAISLSPNKIRNNLIERYASLELSANIPSFETYIKKFLASTATDPLGVENAATNITTTSATLNALVNPNSALSDITFEYGSTPDLGQEIIAIQSPLLADKATPVNAEISDLAPGTTYYYRVMAANEKGTSYSDTIEFMTLGSTPVINGTSIKDIQPYQAVIAGEVSVNHLTTEVSVEYGKTSDFTDALVKTLDPQTDNIPQQVEINLPELEAATLYYARLKATNELGTVTSEVLTFTTKGAVPDVIGFTVEGVEPDIIDLSGKVLINQLSTTVTIEYGTTPQYGSSFNVTEEVVIDNMEIDIFGTLTGLQPDTQYYMRLRAENELGVAYSPEEVVRTKTDKVSFTVFAYSPRIDYLYFEYDMIEDSDENILSHGIVMSQSQGPIIEENMVTAGTGPKPYEARVYDFEPSTTYYVRTFATNKFGTSYSEEISITTASLPVVYTEPNFNWTGTRIKGGGKVDFVGVNTSAGLSWSLSPNPTIEDNFIQSDILSTVGNFDAEITGLEFGTTYYVRAYATNEAGTSYGEEIQITTSPTPMVGDPYEGGIVVHINQPLMAGYVEGEVHGLIAANEDQGLSQWGCNNSDVEGLSEYLGTGQDNTVAIVNYHDNLEDYYSNPTQCDFNNDGSVAAKICNDLVLNGFDDWYLPSREELQYLEENKHFLGIQSGMYWSSSVGPNSVKTAYNQYSELIAKTSKLKVRAFRSF